MKLFDSRSLVLIVFGLLLMLAIYPLSKWSNRSPDQVAESRKFADELDAQAADLQDRMVYVQGEIRQAGAARAQVSLAKYFEEELSTRNFIIDVFRNDELIVWSDNSISPISLLRAAAQGKQILRFENGWYRVLYLSDGIEEYCGAILIKHDFPYENRYLSNRFTPGFRFPGIQNMGSKPGENSVKLAIRGENFYLHFGAVDSANRWLFWLVLIIYFVGFTSLLLGFRHMVVTKKERSPWIIFLLTALVLIAVRAIGLSLGWPAFLGKNALFSPTLYASSDAFPSLIDFFLNAVVLGFIVKTLKYAVNRVWASGRAPSHFAIFAAAVLALLFYGAYINYLLKGLVLNSNIPFSISDILELKFSSFLGIGCAYILLYSFFDLARTVLLSESSRSPQREEWRLTIVLIATLAFIAMLHTFRIRDMISVLWPSAALLVIILDTVTNRSSKSLHLGWIMVGVLMAGGVAAHSFLKYNDQREQNQREVLAEKIAIDEDPVAEILFPEVKQTLQNDRSVQNVFEENELHSREILEDYVLSRYFNGYWSKYDIHLYCFEADSSIWGKLPDVRPKTFAELQNEIDRHGVESEPGSGLYYLSNSKDLITYMAIIPMNYTGGTIADGYFVFEMGSKFFPRQVGFPSLLIDGTNAGNIADMGYSSARYIDNTLIQSQGNFAFRSHLSEQLAKVETRARYSYGTFHHLVNRIDTRTVVIISRANLTPFDKATTYSYLCVIFGLLLLFNHFLIWLVQGRPLFDLNLNHKIQALLVVLTMASLLLYAFATRYYIEKNFTEKNTAQISEKMQSILLELKAKLGEEEQLDYDISDMLNRILNHLSYVFFTDVNVYTPSGNLLASSQIRMFNEGLVSRTIDPIAFPQLAYFDQIEYIHEEKIGNLAYYSGYTPFYNTRGQLLAYINLPYFAKQKELDHEISRFLVTVINLFVLLFLISILVGLLTTQWITSPLRSIRESLAEVQFGRNNNTINYRGSDEIGRLVAEYNAKVIELEENADRLAQSERESAWREMAKQVAHEIKNPLTPMKLRVQHAMKLVDQSGALTAEQFKPLAEGLIEQIDTLSAIASAFSDFARMPQPEASLINIWTLAEQSAALFETSTEIKFRLVNRSSGHAMVHADKKQILRVLNNLIKNAVQATDGNPEGLIVIGLEEKSDGYELSIRDNGSGISPEARPYLFTPNFTTKTTGMGLGLAISKNIVEQAKGRIWFESIANQGTVFYVWLPRDITTD